MNFVSVEEMVDSLILVVAVGEDWGQGQF